ncbi:hypothetical protein Aab01nite_46290 [Paractinoplanes abujensis]|uniref:Uncharacterized protein n=1 Tax=Paractinoplanes abujensis TaxID=882441 RepID=A0A7W7CNY0_9ACTN|nr:hypothetical protein [Actinoplanes abujensis]MBB4690276.1 hypothetical protein [Actinoplanes abujensis]GID21039.1 hypothetical protein Aab01nite_46290 [Actinoplanes abujensis]
MATLLTEQEKEQFRGNVYVAVSAEFRSRMPPRFDPSELLIRLYEAFQPPDFAEERGTAMKGALAWAEECLVPPWRDTYADEELRQEALTVLMGSHRRMCPQIHPAVIALPTDRHRWVYLLFRFRRFKESGALEVIGMSRDDFRRHHAEAREIIRSHLKR